MAKYQVAVYHNGATHPAVINPCRSKEEAETLAAHIKDRCERNGWNHEIVIERNA